MACQKLRNAQFSLEQQNSINNVLTMAETRQNGSHPGHLFRRYSAWVTRTPFPSIQSSGFIRSRLVVEFYPPLPPTMTTTVSTMMKTSIDSSTFLGTAPRETLQRCKQHHRPMSGTVLHSNSGWLSSFRHHHPPHNDDGEGGR